MKDRLRVAWMATVLATLAGISSAQDTSQSTSLGDIARKARAENANAPHAAKVVTNEDFGPHLEPVREDEDPADAVNKAHAALAGDTRHTCREEIANNSGPGSTTESLREIAGPDRLLIVTDRRGGPGAGHDELIVIGSDAYHRNSAGPWQKIEHGKFPAPIGGTGGPEAIWKTYSPGAPAQGPWGTSLTLVRKEAVDGAPTFLYEEKFHPGGVGIRTQTDDIWVGADDHLPRKAETVLVESAPGIAPIIQRDTMTCFYGPGPEIKSPL
jgi:hypothetical protein